MLIFYFYLFLISINYLNGSEEENRPIIQELFTLSKPIEGKQFNIVCQLNGGKKTDLI